MKLFKIFAILGLLLQAQSALSDPNHSSQSCGSGDLTGASFITCSGYYDGNLISDSKSAQTKVEGILSSLYPSLTNATWLEKVDISKSNIIDFKTNLTGVTVIGVHKGGAGAGSDGTAFYVIDAGTSVDKLSYNLGGLSNAAIYSLSTISPVPESSTFAMMIAGFFAVGFVASRRKKLI